MLILRRSSALNWSHLRHISARRIPVSRVAFVAAALRPLASAARTARRALGQSGRFFARFVAWVLSVSLRLPTIRPDSNRHTVAALQERTNPNCGYTASNDRAASD
jgi:hypothetical protein